MRIRLIPILVLGLLIAGCLQQNMLGAVQEASLKDEIVAQSVEGTLQALAEEKDQQVEPAWGLGAPGELHSVEVTQLPLTDPAADGGQSEGKRSLSGFPDSHYIWNIWGHRQFYPIGCEASAADDWARYFGVEINEFNFQSRIPLSDNPDLGFVGDVTGPWGQVPPYAYGVHAAPVAKVLQDHYGMNAAGVKGFTLDELKAEVAADRPVIAWVIGNCTWSEPYEYTDKEGAKVITAPYEHVVIVTGYNETHIRYMNNGKFYDIPAEYFERSWAVLGNMVVYLKE